MTSILYNFNISHLNNRGALKSSLVISPPIYDTQYWSEWSQPYGLLRITALLKKYKYNRIELFDFLEVDSSKRLHRHRINIGDTFIEYDKPERPIKPYIISKPGDPDHLTLYKYHFGKTWEEFDEWLEAKGFTEKQPPDEIWISSVMTYWWESTRDLIARLRMRFGSDSRIILGGIYPTLAPQHAAEYTKPDIVVVGEVAEANDLWTDLSLYETPPSYAIITPSRGCPFDCSYCAQKTLNESRNSVHYRSVDDIYAEMVEKYDRYGIRDFALYADYLLWRYKTNLLPLLEKVASNRKQYPFRLYAPEGLDVNILAQSQHLVDMLKAAGFQKLYLPCESIDDEYVQSLNRKHVKLEHFVKAAHMVEKAGFRMRNLEVNGFVLYGLPGESVDRVVKTSLFVSDVVGSIIPMLFTPVPSTKIFREHLPYFQERGWDKNIHMLNGKLYPFLEMNEGSIGDYIDMQRLMFMLNTHYRSSSFQIFGESKVSEVFRDNMRNGFENFVQGYKDLSETLIPEDENKIIE